jgi:hypothetical protein
VERKLIEVRGFRGEVQKAWDEVLKVAPLWELEERKEAAVTERAQIGANKKVLSADEIETLRQQIEEAEHELRETEANQDRRFDKFQGQITRMGQELIDELTVVNGIRTDCSLPMYRVPTADELTRLPVRRQASTQRDSRGTSRILVSIGIATAVARLIAVVRLLLTTELIARWPVLARLLVMTKLIAIAQFLVMTIDCRTNSDCDSDCDWDKTIEILHQLKLCANPAFTVAHHLHQFHLTRIRTCIELNKSVFAGSRLTGLLLPTSIHLLSGSAFLNLSLASIVFWPGRCEFQVHEMFIEDVARRSLIRSFGSSTAVVVESRIDIMREWCFSNCTSLTSVTFD